MVPFSAGSPRCTITVAPARIPASTIAAPATRSAKGSLRRDAREAGAEVALDHGRLEAGLAGLLSGLLGGGLLVLRQAHHFQRAGAVGQAMDEAALLEPGDQAVDARLGLEAEGRLHLVEGRRDTMLGEVLVDENQQLVLLAREHRRTLLSGACIRNKSSTLKSVLVWFARIRQAEKSCPIGNTGAPTGGWRGSRPSRGGGRSADSRAPVLDRHEPAGEGQVAHGLAGARGRGIRRAIDEAVGA